MKAKVGFKLLPVALEGLGQVTPLLNLDTVNDLLVCLRNLLQLDNSPVEVRVLCIHCAMNTLLGPGQSLSVDDTMYYQQLVIVMKELTLQFKYWPALVDCVDMMLLKKRIDDQDTAKSIFKLLVIHAIIRAADIGGILLAVAHNILLRYPRLRQFMLDKWHNAKGIMIVAEEKVEDWAMEALRNPAEMRRNDKFAREHRDKDEAVETGKWTVMMLKGCMDRNRCQKIVDTMLSTDIKPLPFRAVDAVPGAAVKLEEESMEQVKSKSQGKFNKRKHNSFVNDHHGNNKHKKQRAH
ncbi:hypothetical protein EON65_17890 [archaeon]|nr:MAG: hypothetical protein EON65_17890 [archaeon]